VIQFHSGEQFAISRIPMEKCLMVWDSALF
jgi:hypothetical protein